MGLQVEECRGDDDAHRDGGSDKEPAAAGCHTPRRAAAPGAGTAGECPPAPRKRRPVAPSANEVVARRPRGFYAGADLEAFFAAHGL